MAIPTASFADTVHQVLQGIHHRYSGAQAERLPAPRIHDPVSPKGEPPGRWGSEDATYRGGGIRRVPTSAPQASLPLQELEDMAGFRRDRLTRAEQRIRAYVHREIKTRHRATVPLRTSRLARILNVHVNTIRAARDLLCDQGDGIGYFRVVRALPGEPWEVTLGWEDVDNLEQIAAKLLARRPRRPRRGRTRETSSEGGVVIRPPERKRPAVAAGPAGGLFPERAFTVPPSVRSSPRRPLRVWTRTQTGEDDPEDCHALVGLAESIGLDEPYLQLLVNRHAAGDLLPYFRQAAYGTDLRNPGGWLRRTLVRAEQAGKLRPRVHEEKQTRSCALGLPCQ